MTRRRIYSTREPHNGRVKAHEMGDTTDRKLLPGYAGVLDMSDPDSIRAYVRHALAMNSPTIAGLKRLEMLMDIAAALPVSAATSPAKLVLVDAKDAAEELAKRLGTR